MIVATAGHVDHGKTLLVEALTGIRTDRLEEEQVRGLTIDLGFAYTRLGEERVGFIDVPGHIRFIANMLSGVSVIDYALLVIAADDGPMPQTREHLAILQLLNIQRGAIALTKIDRVEAARIDEVTASIVALVKGTALESCPIIPVSAITGEGLPALKQELTRAAEETVRRQHQGHFRLAVDRCFSVKGAGLVVTGSVFGGEIKSGDEAWLLPKHKHVRIRGIHRQNTESDRGEAGDRCALNLVADISRDEVHRGNWISTSPVDPSERADARISVLSNQDPIRHWTPVHVHSAASHATARIAVLESGQIAPGDTGLIQLVFDEAITLWRGDRIVIRDQAASRTLGGGIILDPKSPRRGRAKPSRLRYLECLEAESASQRLRALLQISPMGLSLTAFRQAEGTTSAEGDVLLSQMSAILVDPDWIIGGEHLAELQRTALETIAHWLQHNPGNPSLSSSRVATLLPGQLRAGLLRLVLANLVASGQLSQTGSEFRLPGHEVQLNQQETRLWQLIEPLLRASLTQPPVVHDLAKQLNLSPRDADKALNRFAQIEFLIKPVPNRFFLPEGIATLVGQVKTLAAGSPDGTFTVREFRDAAGIGRNLCIEILEYCDRKGMTIRMGDKRKLATRGPGV